MLSDRLLRVMVKFHLKVSGSGSYMGIGGCRLECVGKVKQLLHQAGEKTPVWMRLWERRGQIHSEKTDEVRRAEI